MRNRVAVALVLCAGLSCPRAVAGQAAKAAPPPGLPLEHPAAPTRPAIDAADLETRVYILAADSMLGRQAGGPGNVKATDYLAAEAKRLGLQPAGEDGTYFQTIPLVFRSPDSASTLSIAGSPLALGKDFLAIPGVPAFPFGWGFETSGSPTVFGGQVGDTSGLKPGQYAGKIVVLAPRAIGIHPSFMFWAFEDWGRYRGAAGIAVATLDISPPFIVTEGVKPLPTLADLKLAGHLPGGVVIRSDVVRRLFGKPMTELHVGDEGARLAGSVRFVDRPAPFPARNVVALLPGRDARLAHEYVAVGAHSDHVGTGEVVAHDSLEAFNRIMRPDGNPRAGKPTPEQWTRMLATRDSVRARWPERPDSIFNGAMDNASGTAALLEVAELLARGQHPRRPVLFVWHTAEEIRYLGARWFTDHPTVPREQVVAQINLDGLAHREGDLNGGMTDGELATIGAGRLSSAFGALVDDVARRQGVALDRKYDAVGQENHFYCRSDHYLYARYGIPSVFFTTAMFPGYHLQTDEAQYLDYAGMARLTRFAGALVRAAADLDRRPAIDPGRAFDPEGPCVQ